MSSSSSVAHSTSFQVLVGSTSNLTNPTIDFAASLLQFIRFPPLSILGYLQSSLCPGIFASSTSTVQFSVWFAFNGLVCWLCVEPVWFIEPDESPVFTGFGRVVPVLTVMEKPNGEAKKKVKILNTSSIQLSQQQQQQQQQIAFQLVGSIVEKGIDDSGTQKKTTTAYSFPKPTVVPFPVARHRSHGPTRLQSEVFVVDRSMLDVFTFSASSGWQRMQSIEIFGRGGPAPGMGVGWGAHGGGFWSKTVLPVQTDARLLVCLLQIFENTSNDAPETEQMTFSMQRVNTALGLCLTAGPADMVVIEKTLDLLFHVSILKYLDLCIQNFLLNRRGKAFGWKYEDDDYMHFSRMLSSHFRSRWLSVRVKSKAVDGSSSSGVKATPKADVRLDTIYEDSDMSSTTSPCCNSLMIEWARQNLPLPVHFYLSPISTIPLTKRAGPQKVGSVHNPHDPANLLEVAKCGLFFVLGIETMSSFIGTGIPSPIQRVSLTWKLHSLSVNFLVGMEILEQDQGRETFEALQDLYGELLDKERFNQNKEAISDDKKHIEFLRFKSDIHESYSTFIEELVEQFSSISYGDLIFGRQVSVYLHCCVESSIRLATWNTLSNARVLELLPPLEKCFSGAEGYLEPAEDNEEILEAYAKSWVSDALDRAEIRGSVSYTMAVHHLSSFIFNACPVDKLLLRNRLVRSLLRDYAGKQQHEGMLMNLISHNKQSTSNMDEQLDGLLHEESWLESRMKVLNEACEGNSSLLTQVKKLKDAAEKNSL
ncbi:hypothetical protein MTR_1g031840 [Medicago truncatula]|uniref:RPAP1/MINIYO-like TPR repeats domain-containing protein n=1 Tax=Medicago truncatula TaxID=3880 RepID=A0A072VEX4_MEDTR|nr:hypothetical protein MTR_1g031840 [Medicago truncatula]